MQGSAVLQFGGARLGACFLLSPPRFHQVRENQWTQPAHDAENMMERVGLGLGVISWTVAVARSARGPRRIYQ